MANQNVRSYSLVTLAYWGFTMTDGALRMLVLLHFHKLGFSPVQLAFLFLLYELCGVATNLIGGWIGSRFGLRITLYTGLAIQITALVLLAQTDPAWSLALSVGFVMGAQALSGIAKDLTKMSSKSAVKLLAPATESGSERGLFKWVSILTGSKNTLKGVGFFLGGILLTRLGFENSLYAMAIFLGVILIASLIGLREEMGRSKTKVKFSGIFSKNREINILSIARFFLFAARDIWFVVALPVFLSELGWGFDKIGAFMAAWVIGYGIVQAMVPAFARSKRQTEAGLAIVLSRIWGTLLFVVTAGIGIAVLYNYHLMFSILGGLAIFGVIFAINSSLHSFLILSFSDSDKVALNVGFYYMANALGRLAGTLLSGLTFIWKGLPGCLWTSAGFLFVAAFLTFFLKSSRENSDSTSTVPC
ncbi:MAG: organoarsenical effux MFS transporter ArsJ [Verrucomicrobiales bacterium]|nr:organoarsenical effux MFS transporter ArsJ [Verrucomicrobiales bacterium]